MDKQDAVAALMRKGPVIPVIMVEDAAHAVPLAIALVAGGVTVLEVTLRTAAGLEAIRRMAGEVEGAIVGVGTVRTGAQLKESAAAGARFAVSPGATGRLLDAAEDVAIPLLPGAASASEVMTLLERGYRHQKCFPAEPAGGIPFLKSLASPLPEVRFCPTGGVSPANASAYLALPNVLCVGGSWLVPGDAIRAGDWAKITELAKGASALRAA